MCLIAVALSWVPLNQQFQSVDFPDLYECGLQSVECVIYGVVTKSTKDVQRHGGALVSFYVICDGKL